MMTLLRQARLSLDAHLLSFEVMWSEYYALTIAQLSIGAAPIDPGFALYAVIEVSGRTDEDSASALTGVLETAFESALLVDAVLAKSETQRKNNWRIRDESDVIETTGDAYLSYDVGMQLKPMPAYVELLKSIVTENHLMTQSLILFRRLKAQPFLQSMGLEVKRRAISEAVDQPLTYTQCNK